MPTSPIPHRTEFLERDQRGNLTGRVNRYWILWLMELANQTPIDPNALLALTIEEVPATDIAEESSSRTLLATQVEPAPADEGRIGSIASQLAMMMADTPAPPTDLALGEQAKAQSVTTGSVGASSYASVTLTWTTPFRDSNYLVWVAVLESTASINTLRIHHVESKSSTQVVVGVYNDDAANPHTGTLMLFAVHL